MYNNMTTICSTFFLYFVISFIILKDIALYTVIITSDSSNFTVYIIYFCSPQNHQKINFARLCIRLAGLYLYYILYYFLSGELHNFVKVSWEIINNLEVPYDIGSVMHYNGMVRIFGINKYMYIIYYIPTEFGVSRSKVKVKILSDQ